jgi:hypothetical protein
MNLSSKIVQSGRFQFLAGTLVANTGMSGTPLLYIPIHCYCMLHRAGWRSVQAVDSNLGGTWFEF